MFLSREQDRGIFSYVYAISGIITVLVIFIPLYFILSGSNSNEKGEITAISNGMANVKWHDKIGDHTGALYLSVLGKDENIAEVGDKVNLDVKIYGLFDRIDHMTNQMFKGEQTDSEKKEEVKVVGLDLWFFQRWYRNW